MARKSLFKIIRQHHRYIMTDKIRARHNADLLSKEIVNDIQTFCYRGMKHLAGDHPSHHAFNRILFYIAHPEYVQFIEEERNGKKRSTDTKEETLSANAEG